MIQRAGALLAACLVAALAGVAQTPTADLRVYSEFQRIDPFGNVVPADRARGAGVGSREILSPGLARNAHASYHIAVTVPAGTPFTLFVGQNPEDFLDVAVYKEIYIRRGAQWIPDGLKLVTLPYTGRLPDPSVPIPGQTTVAFFLDLQVPANVPIGRTKLEPELYLEERWITWPMEVRILPAIVPAHEMGGVALAGVEEPSDTTARGALRTYLCGSPAADLAARDAIRWFISRNAQQDIALARSLEPRPGLKLLPEILRLAGSGNPAKWCEAPVFPQDLGPEWYLRMRDALHRMRN
jgi:hypothetical protein